MVSAANSSDRNTENKAGSLDNSNNILSSQVSQYSPQDRTSAYIGMQPTGGEQYLPGLNITNLSDTGAVASQNAAGSDYSGTSGSPIASSFDNVGTPGSPSTTSENVGLPTIGGTGSDVVGGSSTTEVQHPYMPQPPVNGYNNPEINEVNNAVNEIDNTVQKGHIASGLSDLNRLTAQWQQQNPSDANSMESQLMDQLGHNYTSDGMSGSEVMEQLGSEALSKSFDQYSQGTGQVNQETLNSYAENDSDPVTQGLAEGASMAMITSGQNNDAAVGQSFFSEEVANARSRDQYQYQNPQPVVLGR